MALALREDGRLMDFETFALEHLMCPRCEARPKDPCITVTGSRASAMHSPRVDPVREAYAAGHTAAEQAAAQPSPGTVRVDE